LGGRVGGGQNYPGALFAKPHAQDDDRLRPRGYQREHNPIPLEDSRGANNLYLFIGKETCFPNADHELMLPAAISSRRIRRTFEERTWARSWWR
jgi:hypothetical protein